MNADGTNPVNLTRSPHHGEDAPSWSPDGSKISFRSTFYNYRDGTIEREGIYVMNADGTNPIKTNQFDSSGYRPAWSPDSSKIAFTCSDPTAPGLLNREQIHEICVMNADGTNLVRLTHNSVRDARPVWSPDGSKIAFTCSLPIVPISLNNREICVINPDGTNFVRLTHNSFYDHSPVWSPDGSKIVFEQSSYNRRSYIVNADGTNPLRVRLSETLELFYGDTREADGILAKNPKLFDVYNFGWWPDGSKILYQTTAPIEDMYHSDSRLTYFTLMNADGTNSRIGLSIFPRNYYIVMNADGTNPFGLDVPAPAWINGDDWSSDGFTLVHLSSCPFSACDGLKIRVYKLRYRRRGSLQATLLNLSPWQAWVHLYCLKDRDPDADPCEVTFECNGQSGEPVAWPVTVAPKTIFSYWPNKTAPDGTDADLQAALIAAGKPEDEARRRTTCEVFSPDPLTVRGYTLFGGQPTLVPVAEPARPDVAAEPGERRRQATLPNLSPGQAWVHLYCLKDRGTDAAPCAVTFECNGQSGEPVTWPVEVGPKTIFSYWPNKTVDGLSADLQAALIAAGKPEDEARRRTTCEVSSGDPIAVRGYTRFGGQPTLVPVPAYPLSR